MLKSKSEFVMQDSKSLVNVSMGVFYSRWSIVTKTQILWRPRIYQAFLIYRSCIPEIFKKLWFRFWKNLKALSSIFIFHFCVGLYQNNPLAKKYVPFFAPFVFSFALVQYCFLMCHLHSIWDEYEYTLSIAECPITVCHSHRRACCRCPYACIFW